ncbi:MAG TPA: LysM domain-containing protein, partial [Alphaproteobacteria bacterium]
MRLPSVRLVASLAFLGTVLASCGFLGVPAPKSGPASTPTTAIQQPQAAPETVTVQAGDTLYAISRRSNTPIRAIIDANGLT